jgi:hypothetical protein
VKKKNNAKHIDRSIVGRRKSLSSGMALSLQLMISFFSILCIAACHTETSLSPGNSVTQLKKQSNNPYASAEIATKIIPSVNNTFGYDILLYGRPFVHQPNIPGLPGNEGFATQERAQGVADLVKKKIRNNEMPPTVTIEELNTMGVLK